MHNLIRCSVVLLALLAACSGKKEEAPVATSATAAVTQAPAAPPPLDPKYHATTSVYEAKDLKDGLMLGMANGQKVAIKVAADGAITVNDARILASVRGSNGVVHVIDAVLIPPPR